MKLNVKEESDFITFCVDVSKKLFENCMPLGKMYYKYYKKY